VPTLPPTGKRIDAPCCDVFGLVDGKIIPAPRWSTERICECAGQPA
jgi:hypothetical protein